MDVVKHLVELLACEIIVEVVKLVLLIQVLHVAPEVRRVARRAVVSILHELGRHLAEGGNSVVEHRATEYHRQGVHCDLLVQHIARLLLYLKQLLRIQLLRRLEQLDLLEDIYIRPVVILEIDR